MLDVAQMLLIQSVTPAWYCSHGNCGRTALRACSSSGLEKVSSRRLVFLLSSEDPGPWESRDPMAVEPSLCPRKFQELAEPEPLEAEAAPASNAATRAASLQTACSTFEILFVLDATDCVSDRILFSNLVKSLYEHGNRCKRLEM